MKYLYVLLALAIFGGLFILVYYLNSKTKKPDGCNELPEECKQCKVSFCGKKKSEEKEK